MSFRPRKIDRERVARGAAILDQEFPGWEKHVNWSTLMISSSTNCVLAQVGRAMTQGASFNEHLHYPGGYAQAEHRAEKYMNRTGYGVDLTEFGFNVDYADHASNTRLMFAWKTEIEDRLTPDEPSPEPAKRTDYVLAS